ncbi:S-antigen, N-terminal domain-containing protein [Glomus cerebriforme]|uniref:S-antigen, N-terminal domain-containing protein n=1 Tax=Glomus cerebriforme TaxID=658196 RepID=A0A397TLF1_9GLOM|nr:S-antigen, N-terminal domain-containing protein [Glomus cerebriforme]
MFNKNKKSISLEIILDDDFNGMMYGLPEESLGCKLSGKVILNNRNPLTTKHLLFIFVGKISVSCGPPMSSSRPEYSEIKTIFRKECVFHNSGTSNKRIPAGTHEYYFEFDLPGNLPSSFKGIRGKIEYYCTAILARPVFHNDLTVKKTVNIKRCLMDETRAAQVHHTTFTEGLLDEKIRYQISYPIMAFREGGLVQYEISLKSTNPNIVIESIEYGLKEQIHYHTTGEEGVTIIANVNEDRYPLGKRQIKFDSNDASPITTNFRLCPWVNFDVDTQLINIKHKLSFTVYVSEIINNETFFTERRFSAPTGRAHRIVSFSLLSSSNNNNNYINNNNINTNNNNTNNNNNNNNNNSNSNSNRRNLRNSRTFSLSNIINSQRTEFITKVETKRLHFEVPIIITAKSCKPPSTPPYAFVDRPPAYAIASMVPPPPEYFEIGTEFSPGNYISNDSNDYVEYDFE